jgi:hypothetical protein
VADRTTPPLPKAPSWSEFHATLAEVRDRVTDMGVSLRALAEVWEAMSQYEGDSDFERGTARAYGQAAKEIRLIMGDEE